jgi:DNA-binding beta-propeller fold protein YncE
MRVAIGGGLLLAGALGVPCRPLAAQSAPIPTFELDPSWPKPLPNNWTFGDLWGVATDSRDHVWLLHAKSEESRGWIVKEGKEQAPPVVELDADGNFVQAWGGPGNGYTWMENPIAEHGIWVDPQDNVWVTGNGHVALKFTRTGKFQLQIGQLWKTNGSNDHALLGNSTGLTVDPRANEVFIADGYVNRRIIVFDATTGEYKRHWGAYGKVPDDGPAQKLINSFDPSGPSPSQFNPTHCARISRDGFLYVCDRGHNRFHVFRTDGTFVNEVYVDKQTPASHEFDHKAGQYVTRSGPGNFVGSVSSAAFSADPQQQYLYIGGSTSYPRVYVFRRSDLQLLGSFETKGNHEIATDSRGNLYTVDGYSRRPLKYALKSAAGR